MLSRGERRVARVRGGLQDAHAEAVAHEGPRGRVPRGEALEGRAAHDAILPLNNSC